MAKARKKRPFDVKVFLNTVDGGRTVATYRKNQKVFSQGDPADSVFYIQEGQGQGLRRLRAGEGGGRRAPRERGLLRRGLPDRPAAARWRRS